MNGVTASFTGRLSFDPERRYTQGGVLTLQFLVMVDEDRRRPDTLPTTVRVTCWEALAEGLASQLEKGDSVYAEGRLSLGRWTGSDGQPKAGLNLSATRLEVHGQINRRSTGLAPAQHRAGPVLGRPSADRPADDDSPFPEAHALPEPVRLARERIAAAAAAGSLRAATRRPWGR